MQHLEQHVKRIIKEVCEYWHLLSLLTPILYVGHYISWQLVLKKKLL